MSSLFGLYGASGCGRGIMPLARESLGASPTARLVFIDDALAGQRLNGHEVMDFDTFCRDPADQRHVAVAIANPSTRAAVVLKFAAVRLRSEERRVGRECDSTWRSRLSPLC